MQTAARSVGAAFLPIGTYRSRRRGLRVLERMLDELNFRQILVLIYIVYFWCYGTGNGKHRAGSTGFRGQIPEGHMCSKEPTKFSRHGKDGPQCRRYGFSCAEWLSMCRALERRHARQWRPAVEHVLERRIATKHGGLVARARSTPSLCKSSSVSLVDVVLVKGCIVLLKIC